MEALALKVAREKIVATQRALQSAGIVVNRRAIASTIRCNRRLDLLRPSRTAGHARYNPGEQDGQLICGEPCSKHMRRVGGAGRCAILGHRISCFGTNLLQGWQWLGACQQATDHAAIDSPATTERRDCLALKPKNIMQGASRNERSSVYKTVDMVLAGVARHQAAAFFKEARTVSAKSDPPVFPERATVFSRAFRPWVI